MDKEIEKVTPEVITKQKEATLKDIVTNKLHLEFHEAEFAKKKPKNKEETQNIAHQKLQVVNPIMDNIELKTKYYEFLCKKES